MDYLNLYILEVSLSYMKEIIFRVFKCKCQILVLVFQIVLFPHCPPTEWGLGML